MTLAGWLFAELYFRNKPASFYTYQEGHEEQPEAKIDDNDLPESLVALIPLLIPILLIVLKTTCDMLLPEESPLLPILGFVGNANVALAIGALLAMAMLGKKIGKKVLSKITDMALREAGPIVFITAAGGALGEILKSSGSGDSLAQLVINTGMPFILIPFAISALLVIAQGSGTVAVVTAATLSAPIGMQLGIDPILIFLSSGAGARAFMHVNCSYFWVFTNCMGYDMKTGLKTLSLGNIFMSLGGLLATFIVSFWL